MSILFYLMDCLVGFRIQEGLKMKKIPYKIWANKTFPRRG
jgi:hypothetical protein